MIHYTTLGKDYLRNVEPKINFLMALLMKYFLVRNMFLHQGRIIIWFDRPRIHDTTLGKDYHRNVEPN
jgi:hypothetical protein